MHFPYPTHSPMASGVAVGCSCRGRAVLLGVVGVAQRLGQQPSDVHIIWYTHHGQPARIWPPTAPARWYRHKHAVSVADILSTLRRALLTAPISARSPRPTHPGPIPRRPARPTRPRCITTNHE